MSYLAVLVNRKHQSHLSVEPALIQLYEEPKAAKAAHALDKSWQEWILHLNNDNQKCFDKIADPKFGPSIGIKNGKLMLISAGYWFRQVRVLEDNIPGKGGPFARIACVNISLPIPVTHDPTLVHRVTYEDKKNTLVTTGNPVTDNLYVPLVGLGDYLYVPMKNLAGPVVPRALQWAEA